MSKIIVISVPTNTFNEIWIVNQLFENGLQQFHVRKPNFSELELKQYIKNISEKNHKFLILHSHYHLTKQFAVKGIQVGKNRLEDGLKYKNKFKYFGYSAHSFSEIENLKHHFNSFFLSPIFDSISKTNYKSKFNFLDINKFLNFNNLSIIALGGINANNAKKCINLGFSKVAVLGNIWENKNAISAFCNINESIKTRSYTLSIAGFDPCSGAGITADIKTFEQHKTQGLGVTTAITYQNEKKIVGVDWLEQKQIEQQIDVLLENQKLEFVKIGLIKDLDTLTQIIKLLKKHNNSIKIIWDPILKASAGFNFHENLQNKQLFSLLQHIYLLTPNIPECEKLFNTIEIKLLQNLQKEKKLCNILLKGGHSNNNKVTDILIEPTKITNFDGKRHNNYDKHGTGCVLSSAICANLSNKFNLELSIIKAKKYVSNFIISNNSLLGYHNSN